MARVEVIQVKCDRCKRVETLAPQPAKSKPDFELRMVGPDGNEVSLAFQDTCSYCKTALSNIFTQIKEWEREVKQQFGPTIPANKAAPLTPAPDYTPPKPHSASAAKK
jgi:hypothetical protein